MRVCLCLWTDNINAIRNPINARTRTGTEIVLLYWAVYINARLARVLAKESPISFIFFRTTFFHLLIWFARMKDSHKVRKESSVLFPCPIFIEHLCRLLFPIFLVILSSHYHYGVWCCWRYMRRSHFFHKTLEFFFQHSNLLNTLLPFDTHHVFVFRSLCRPFAHLICGGGTVWYNVMPNQLAWWLQHGGVVHCEQAQM